MKEIIQEVTKASSSPIVHNIYQDLIQPSAIELGKALGTVFASTNTLLLPVEYVNKKCLLKFKERLRKFDEMLKVEKIENITLVPNEIGVPILEKLFYTTNDELAELFLNLLKRASTKDEIHLAHPNFVNVLSSISPDEARIINYFQGNSIPFLSLGLEIKTKRNNMTISIIERSNSYFHNLSNSIELIFPDNFHIYNTNLFCLGITEHMGFGVSPTDIHKKIESENIESIKAYLNQDVEVKEDGSESKIPIVEYGQIDFTEFGKLFISACCKI